MHNWTPDDRVRAARRRDRASRAVAAAGIAATTGTVAATLALASVLAPPPGAVPAPATAESPATASPDTSAAPAGPPADGPTVATTPQDQGSLALRGPDQAPKEQERTTRQKRQDVPQTSGS